MAMIGLAFVYGLVLGLLGAGSAGWLLLDARTLERDRYRRLFQQASREIGKARGRK